MRNDRVLMLVHPAYRPDRQRKNGETERDVWRALRKLGFQVEISEAVSSIRDLDRDLAKFRPKVVFNLLEEFREEGIFDFHAVSYLEALGLPYTGCNPRGLILSRNKIWVSQIAKAENVSTPEPQRLSKNERPSGVEFPAILKFNREHASYGITKRNLVRDWSELRARWKEMREVLAAEVIVQKFIPGKEVTVSVWGNEKLEVLRPWQLHLRSESDFITEKMKFDRRYRRRLGVQAHQYKGPLKEELERAALRMYSAMDLNGYARFDFRIDQNGEPHLIDVNPNPNLAKDEDLACSARASGHDYFEVIERLVELALSYRPRR